MVTDESVTTTARIRPERGSFVKTGRNLAEQGDVKEMLVDSYSEELLKRLLSNIRPILTSSTSTLKTLVEGSNSDEVK